MRRAALGVLVLGLSLGASSAKAQVNPQPPPGGTSPSGTNESSEIAELVQLIQAKSAELQTLAEQKQQLAAARPEAPAPSAGEKEKAAYTAKLAEWHKQLAVLLAKIQKLEAELKALSSRVDALQAKLAKAKKKSTPLEQARTRLIAKRVEASNLRKALEKVKSETPKAPMAPKPKPKAKG